MKEYVLDANAIIRYFKPGKADGNEKVEQLIDGARGGRLNLWMSVVNLGEVFYVLLRGLKDEAALEYIQSLQRAVLIHEPDANHTIQAARLKHRYKLGYADSFAAALAMEKDATLVSADPEFSKIGSALKWMKLPRFRE